jgi:hypothetical protein
MMLVRHSGDRARPIVNRRSRCGQSATKGAPPYVARRATVWFEHLPGRSNRRRGTNRISDFNHPISWHLEHSKIVEGNGQS